MTVVSPVKFRSEAALVTVPANRVANDIALPQMASDQAVFSTPRKRDFTPAEESAIAKALSRSKPLKTNDLDASPLNLLASPNKAGLRTALWTTAIASVVLPIFLLGLSGLTAPVLLGTTAVSAIFGAILGYSRRNEQRETNQHILAIMRRLPQEATIYDLKQNPVYRDFEHQQAVRQAQSANFMNDLVWMSMLSGPRTTNNFYAPPRMTSPSFRTLSYTPRPMITARR